jgi:predicted phage terminase large subunit-like protein
MAAAQAPISRTTTWMLCNRSLAVVVAVEQGKCTDAGGQVPAHQFGDLFRPTPSGRLASSTARATFGDADGSGRDFWVRKPGDLLSPGWTTPQAVDDIRRSLPKEVFEGQYQQNPQFGGSGICSIDRLARFQERSHYELIVHCWDLAGTKSGGDWTVCAKFGLAQAREGREVLDLLEIIRVRIELPDVRELIREQDRVDRPALVVVDGVGIGLAIVQELGREMRHLLPGGSFDDQNVSGLKVRRFHNAMPAMYDGLVRLPTTMSGLETLLAEFAAFPDGRHDDQVDAVCNVAANLALIIHRARLFGEQLGRIRPIPLIVPPTPPRSRDQELYDRRQQYRR